MSENLYQLRSKKSLASGQYVEVNGPHDKYGQVLAVKDDVNEYGTLYLIRGRGHTSPYSDIFAKL